MKTFWNVGFAVGLAVWALCAISMVTGISIGLLAVLVIGAIGVTVLTVALWPDRTNHTKGEHHR